MTHYQTLTNKKFNYSNVSRFLSFSILLLLLFFSSSIIAQETDNYFLKSYDKKMNESYFFNARVEKSADKSYNRIYFTVGCQPGDAFSRGMTLGGFDIQYSVDGDLTKEGDDTVVPVKVSSHESYIFEEEKPSRIAVKLQYLFKILKEVKIGKESIIVDLKDRSYEIELIK